MPPASANQSRVRSIALDVLRHALPLLPLYFARGSLAGYLVLTAFDLSLGLMVIVGTTRETKDPTTVDPRATLLVSRITSILILAVFFGIVAAILTIPIGMPAFIFGATASSDLPTLLSHTNFWITVACMCLAAGARAQAYFEAVTTPGERGTDPHAAPVIGDLEGDRRRAKAAYAAQVTVIVTYVLLCYLLVHFRQAGLYVFPILFAALLVFFDARPDLAQRILAHLWRDAR